MRRLACAALLMVLTAFLAGCSTPSYRIPAGFSSTYHSAMYGGADQLHPEPQEPRPLPSTGFQSGAAPHPAGAALR